jgi:hypothetical protein
MITAIVQYRLPSNIDLKACAEHFRKIAPGFRTVQGLIRSSSFMPRTAGPAASICGRRAPRPRRSIRGRGSPASASATAWIRRSSISTPLA